MPTTRTVTAVTQPVLANTATIAAAAQGVLAMSADGTKLYGGSSVDLGGNNTILYQSTDFATTWTTVHDFGAGKFLIAMLFTEDGEALVSIRTVGAGEVWKSTGWTANPATATWAKVLTLPNSVYAHVWSVSQQSLKPGGTIMIAEYGAKALTGHANEQGYATHLWKSTDNGATWAVVLDIATRYPTQFNLHIHGVIYDAWWDRWWVTFGDQNPIAEPGIATDGSELMTVLYSDDDGAAWTRLPKAADRVTTSTSVTYQTTSIMALEACVLFGPDIAPGGFQRLPRKGFRQAGDLHTINMKGATGTVLLGRAFTPPARKGAPAFLAAANWNAGKYDSLVATVDGRDFYELDTRINTASLTGAERAVGPTTNGRVIVSSAYTGAMQNLVSDLIWET